MAKRKCVRSMSVDGKPRGPRGICGIRWDGRPVYPNGENPMGAVCLWFSPQGTVTVELKNGKGETTDEAEVTILDLAGLATGTFPPGSPLVGLKSQG